MKAMPKFHTTIARLIGRRHASKQATAAAESSRGHVRTIRRAERHDWADRPYDWAADDGWLAQDS